MSFLQKDDLQKNEVVDPHTLPMRWYNFQIKFALFLGAGLNLFSAFNLFRAAAAVPLAFRLVMALLFAAQGAFCLYTRAQLATFSQRGPMCLYLNYIFNAVLQVAYNLGAALLLGQTGTQMELIQHQAGSALMSALFFVLFNRMYFQRRKELFKN